MPDCQFCEIEILTIGKIHATNNSICVKCGAEIPINKALSIYKGAFYMPKWEGQSHKFLLLDWIRCPECGDNLDTFHVQCGDHQDTIRFNRVHKNA